MTKAFACVTSFVAASGAMVFSAAAATGDVVVVRPLEAEPFIEEIFHRLTGELRVHSFSIKQEEGTRADVSLAAAQDLLTRTGADACVFVGWRGETSVVQVWVAGSSTPPALFEAVALQRKPEVPTMLAARAVDLLTAALRPRAQPRAGAPPPSPPLPPETKVVGASANASQSKAALPWSIAAGAAMLGELSAFGAAWGPRISVERAVSPRLKLATRLAGPFIGADHANVGASARLFQGVGLIELLAVVYSTKSFALSTAGGLGAYFARAEGAIADGISSIEPVREDLTTGAASLGVEAAVSLTPYVAVVIAAQALLLLPRPRVVVGREGVAFVEPLLLLNSNIRFTF